MQMQKQEWLERMARQRERFRALGLQGLAEWTELIRTEMEIHCLNGDIVTDLDEPTWPLPLLEGMPENLVGPDLTMKGVDEFFSGTLFEMKRVSGLATP